MGRRVEPGFSVWYRYLAALLSICLGNIISQYSIGILSKISSDPGS